MTKQLKFQAIVFFILMFTLLCYSSPLLRYGSSGEELFLEFKDRIAKYGKFDPAINEGDENKYADVWVGKVKSGLNANDYKWIAVVGTMKDNIAGDIGVIIYEIDLVNSVIIYRATWEPPEDEDVVSFHDAKITVKNAANGNAYGFFASTAGGGVYIVQLNDRGFSINPVTVDRISMFADNDPADYDKYMGSPCFSGSGNNYKCLPTINYEQAHNCWVEGNYILFYNTWGNNAIYIWQWFNGSTLDVQYKHTIFAKSEAVHDITIQERKNPNKDLCIC